MLRRAGHHVEEVASASAALRLLKNCEFDLVITEVLFTLYGVDVAIKIRQMCPEVPIIRTEYMPPVGADASLKEPVPFIFQPVTSEKLLALVHCMLTKRWPLMRSQWR
jgi:two-component SAPR family response regulator